MEETVNQYFGDFCPEKDHDYQVPLLQMIDAYNRWNLGSYETISYLYICRCEDETQCEQGRFETIYLSQDDIDQDTDYFRKIGYHCIFTEQPDLKDHFNRWKLFGDFKYNFKFFGYFFDDLTEKEEGEYSVTIRRSDPVPEGIQADSDSDDQYIRGA
jgi:hypothetical protein